MPTKKLPTASDLPAQLHPVFHSSPRPINIVLFLPGLGDTSSNFSSFARALNLPETMCITLQGPFPLPLPLDPGYHWGDDLLVDQSSGDVELDAGFTKASDLVVNDVLKRVLVKECGTKPQNILLSGYGQGGIAALAIAKAFGEELGGVISIGGSIPASSMLVSGPKVPTPILLLGGSKGALADGERIKSTRGTFAAVEFHQWKKASDSMPQNREEAFPMMQFFARRLRSHQGMPEGSIEVIR